MRHRGRCIAMVFCLSMAATLCVEPVEARQDPAPEPHEGGPEEPSVRPEERALLERMRATAAPGPEHAKLAEMVGSWMCEIKVWREPTDPDAEPVVTKLISQREMSLGGRVLLEMATADRLGQPFVGRRMMGFDKRSGQFWSAATNNMGTGLEVEHGRLTPAGHIEYTGKFDDPGSGATPTRTVYTMPEPDRQVIESYQVLEGEEHRFIVTTCTRGI